MAQWIAILVALVCLSGSSHSRSWVGYEDDDYYGSSQEDPSDNHPYHKKQIWDSEEDYEESGYEHGFGHDKSSHQNYHYDRNDGYFNHDHDQDGFDYHHHDKFNHQGDNYDDKNGHHGHKPDFTPNWDSHQNGHGQMFHKYENEYRHSTVQPVFSNGQFGYQRRPSQTGGQFGSQGRPNQPETGNGQFGSQGRPVQAGNGSGQVPAQRRPSQPGFPVQSGQNSGSPPRGLPQNNQNNRGSANGGDRIVFPDFNNRIPTTRAPSTPRSSTTTPSTTTTNRLLNLVICVRACPVTPEYNPVCGTNNITYNNPGLLECAKNCGIDVSLARRAPCPRLTSITPNPVTNRPTTTRPSTTPRTTTTLPQFTNINNILVNQANTTLIPVDVLVSIFGQPSGNSGSAAADTEEDNLEIDRRRKLTASRL